VQTFSAGLANENLALEEPWNNNGRSRWVVALAAGCFQNASVPLGFACVSKGVLAHRRPKHNRGCIDCSSGCRGGTAVEKQSGSCAKGLSPSCLMPDDVKLAD
jgi:hypothetical protein